MSRALDELEITTLVLKNFPLLGHRCRPSSSATGRFCTGVSHCKPHNLYSFCHGVFMYPFCPAFLLLNFIPRAIRKTLRQSPSSFNRTSHFTHSRTSHFPPNASLRIWSSLNPPSCEFLPLRSIYSRALFSPLRLVRASWKMRCHECLG